VLESNSSNAQVFNPIDFTNRLLSRLQPPSIPDIRKLFSCLSAIHQTAQSFEQEALATALQDICTFLASNFDLDEYNLCGILTPGDEWLDDVKQQFAALPKMLQQVRKPHIRAALS
jgi:hypothetical protein